MTNPVDSARSGRARLAGAVTLGNALCGLIGCVALIAPGLPFTRAFGVAAGCVFAGFAVDRIDGTLARRLGVDTPFGAQIDSLCDVLSFGLLPAVLIVAPALRAPSSMAVAARICLAMGYLAAALVRLARFTLAATGVPGAAPAVRLIVAGEPRYHGLPSSAAAMAVASVTLLEVFGTGGAVVRLAAIPPLGNQQWLTLALCMAAAVAMLQPWPYVDPLRAFRSGYWPRWLLVVLVAVGIIAGPFVAMGLFAVGYLPTGPFTARRLPAAGPLVQEEGS